MASDLAHLHIKMHPSDKREIDDAARRMNQPTAWWVRKVLREAAAATKPSANQERPAAV